VGWPSVDAIVNEHHEALRVWIAAIKKGDVDTPQWILHVDEHHDMLSERLPIGSVTSSTLRCGGGGVPRALVGGVQDDSPRMWLSDEAWTSVRRRFRYATHLCHTWPKPDMMTVCTSPGFVPRGAAPADAGANSQAVPATSAARGRPSPDMRTVARGDGTSHLHTGARSGKNASATALFLPATAWRTSRWRWKRREASQGQDDGRQNPRGGRMARPSVDLPVRRG